MNYIDAGYIIGLSVVFLYGLSLVVRRRRLERAAALAEHRPPGAHGGVEAAADGFPGADAPSGVPSTDGW